jgi:hypothetical protein
MRKLVPLAFVAILAGSCSRVGGLDRTYKLPCEIASFSPSGDGTLVWVSCFGLESKKEDGTDWRPSTLLTVDTANGKLTELVHAVGWIEVVAAPVGDRAAVTVPQKGSLGKVFLYEGARQVSAPPIGPEYIAWSADARVIYFYGGSTTDNEDFDTLGALHLDTLAISRTKLYPGASRASPQADPGEKNRNRLPEEQQSYRNHKSCWQSGVNLHLLIGVSAFRFSA